MTKHFQHMPVKAPDMEAGIPAFEHCLNLIGQNDDFWWSVDHLFETETDLRDRKAIAAFKNDLLDYLANFIYENSPRVADKNSRQTRIEAVESISNAVEKLLKNYKYIKADIFLHFSEKSHWLMAEMLQQGDDSQCDNLQWSAYKKEQEFFENLQFIQKITEQIDLPEREAPAILNAHLQECVAIYLAESLLNIGVKPTTSREGFFEELFRLCCIAIGFNEPKPGNRHVATAVKYIKDNPKRV